MDGRQLSAIEFLVSHPDSVVAEMLGIRISTLRKWMSKNHFSDALRQREREQRAGLARIARQAALNAAVALCQTTSQPGKSDPKVLLEVLKASGAFEAETVDPGEALAEILLRASQEGGDACD